VGLDAAEPRLVRRLIEGGDLPALARLHDEGTWTSVRSPAYIGSGAVWPSFFTGTEPHRHGIYSAWSWSPAAMTLVPRDLDRLRPFWSSLEDDDVTVGVLDIPLAPHVGLSRGFEVTEWGAHDIVNGRTALSPSEIVPAVEEAHPFASGRLEPAGDWDDRVDPAALASGCVAGAALRGELAERLLERTRPDLAVIVFGEIHRSAHDLWHTVEPDHPLYDGLATGEPRRQPDLIGVYREVDRQIARLVDAAGEKCAVVVFSLHGMRPCRGVAEGLLGPTLRELGFAQPARRGGRAVSARGRGALAAVKRHTPIALKRAYHRGLPRGFRDGVAVATMSPVLDWSETRAFALPSDQNGWVRVNLRGREAGGAVAPEDYGSTCDELQDALEQLCTEDGRSLVVDVVRLGSAGAPPALLPDLVVHWSDAAYDQPVRVRDPAIEAWPIAPAITGMHGFEGFCLVRGLEHTPGESIEASELHRLLLDTCGR
jgi:predicted AlkP superfamily phosphohydrolase/phosphomutase